MFLLVKNKKPACGNAGRAHVEREVSGGMRVACVAAGTVLDQRKQVVLKPLIIGGFGVFGFAKRLLQAVKVQAAFHVAIGPVPGIARKAGGFNKSHYLTP
jgi:hypothetical protein